MSRVRISPTEWRDEGPASPGLRAHDTRHAEVVGSMRPVLNGTGHAITRNKVTSAVRGPAYSIHPENRT